ncbi:hypothetical protein [Mycoplasma todarodis]|uniref:hypothetical protein n=1 Tax=Mycoplasma todarodis TaxID=1937191 RepID=UPI003B33E228
MTLNQLKLTSHIVNKFTEQVMPSSSLRIESKEKFGDKSVFLTDHAHSRLNERLELNKEKVEYAQFIRSVIYGTTKTFVTYKNEKIFIANIAFGEVDMTLAFTNTSDDKNYLLLTAFINSTSRFVEFMKKEYKEESKLEQVEQILKDSLFKGKSSEEFFNDFEKEFGLIKDRMPEQKKTEKTYKKVKRTKQPDKEVYSEKLDEKYSQELLKAWGLDKTDDFVTKRAEPVKTKPQPKKRVVVNKETKLHNRNYDDKYANELLNSVGLEEKAGIQPKRVAKPKKITLFNEETKLHNQSLDEDFMEELLNSNTLVQQSVEDIIEVEEVTYNDPIIKEDDRETKIPEQKEIVTQELDEDFMNELLGDL